MSTPASFSSQAPPPAPGSLGSGLPSASDLAASELAARQSLASLAIERERCFGRALILLLRLQTQSRLVGRNMDALSLEKQSAEMALIDAETECSLRQEVMYRVEETRRFLVNRVKCAQWEKKSHFHLTAIDHMLGNTQPALFDVATMLRGHLRICSMARASMVAQAASASIVQQHQSRKEDAYARIKFCAQQEDSSSSKALELRHLVAELLTKLGNDLQRFLERKRRARRSGGGGSAAPTPKSMMTPTPKSPFGSPGQPSPSLHRVPSLNLGSSMIDPGLPPLTPQTPSAALLSAAAGRVIDPPTSGQGIWADPELLLAELQNSGVIPEGGFATATAGGTFEIEELSSNLGATQTPDSTSGTHSALATPASSLSTGAAASASPSYHLLTVTPSSPSSPTSPSAGSGSGSGSAGTSPSAFGADEDVRGATSKPMAAPASAAAAAVKPRQSSASSSLSSGKSLSPPGSLSSSSAGTSPLGMSPLSWPVLGSAPPLSSMSLLASVTTAGSPEDIWPESLESLGAEHVEHVEAVLGAQHKKTALHGHSSHSEGQFESHRSDDAALSPLFGSAQQRTGAAEENAVSVIAATAFGSAAASAASADDSTAAPPPLVLAKFGAGNSASSASTGSSPPKTLGVSVSPPKRLGLGSAGAEQQLGLLRGPHAESPAAAATRQNVLGAVGAVALGVDPSASAAASAASPPAVPASPPSIVGTTTATPASAVATAAATSTSSASASAANSASRQGYIAIKMRYFQSLGQASGASSAPSSSSSAGAAASNSSGKSGTNGAAGKLPRSMSNAAAAATAAAAAGARKRRDEAAAAAANANANHAASKAIDIAGSPTSQQQRSAASSLPSSPIEASSVPTGSSPIAHASSSVPTSPTAAGSPVRPRAIFARAETEEAALSPNKRWMLRALPATGSAATAGPPLPPPDFSSAAGSGHTGMTHSESSPNLSRSSSSSNGAPLAHSNSTSPLPSMLSPTASAPPPSPKLTSAQEGKKKKNSWWKSLWSKDKSGAASSSSPKGSSAATAAAQEQEEQQLSARNSRKSSSAIATTMSSPAASADRLSRSYSTAQSPSYSLAPGSPAAMQYASAPVSLLDSLPPLPDEPRLLSSDWAALHSLLDAVDDTNVQQQRAWEVLEQVLDKRERVQAEERKLAATAAVRKAQEAVVQAKEAEARATRALHAAMEETKRVQAAAAAAAAAGPVAGPQQLQAAPSSHRSVSSSSPLLQASASSTAGAPSTSPTNVSSGVMVPASASVSSAADSSSGSGGSSSVPRASPRKSVASVLQSVPGPTLMPTSSTQQDSSSADAAAAADSAAQPSPSSSSSSQSAALSPSASSSHVISAPLSIPARPAAASAGSSFTPVGLSRSVPSTPPSSSSVAALVAASSAALASSSAAGAASSQHHTRRASDSAAAGVNARTRSPRSAPPSVRSNSFSFALAAAAASSSHHHPSSYSADVEIDSDLLALLQANRSMQEQWGNNGHHSPPSPSSLVF